MAEHQVLFCPFCRESFEGLRVCPEHELTLVPFAGLPAGSVLEAAHDDDSDEPRPPPDRRVVGLFEPRFGRAWVALGALLECMALALPLADFAGREIAGYQLARAIPSLWTLGLIGFTVGYTLARRRTPLALRGLRVLMPALGGVSLASLLWAHARLDWAARPALGSYAIGAGALCLILGGLRLGGRREEA
jgi:hypothetical protein